jgi:hypothetical protein
MTARETRALVRRLNALPQVRLPSLEGEPWEGIRSAAFRLQNQDGDAARTDTMRLINEGFCTVNGALPFQRLRSRGFFISHHAGTRTVAESSDALCGP